MRQITKRLTKGTLLKEEIIRIAEEENLKAGVIVCSVGSLEKVHIRMAGAKETKKYEGDFELISLNGRIAENGSHVHLHLSFSDENGKMYGGHLMEGCVVRTTVELVILGFENVIYRVEEDKNTGFKELTIV